MGFLRCTENTWHLDELWYENSVERQVFGSGLVLSNRSGVPDKFETWEDASLHGLAAEKQCWLLPLQGQPLSRIPIGPSLPPKKSRRSEQ